MVNNDHIELSQKYQPSSCEWVENIAKCPFRGHPNFEIMAILNLEEEITLEEEQERALQEQMDIGKS